MNIEIITMYYKDEYLAQFYLRHYAWADKITLITKTLPSGIDNQAQADWYTEAYKNSKADWILLPDMDEFIFINREELEKIPRDINIKEVALHDIYPHVTESELNPELPVKEQRRHGYLFKPFFIKPIIIRGGLDIQIGIGRHGISGKGLKMGSLDILGSHWRNCSLEYAIDTRLNKRKNRFSQEDINKGLAARDRLETEELIRKEFKDHENDLQVF